MSALPTNVEASVRCWFERFVLDLNLCPFAARALARDGAGALRVEVSTAASEQALLQGLVDELVWLHDHDNVETTLLVHPLVLADFLDYNDFLQLADELLVSSGLEGVLQIASFHPGYQFAGTELQAAENYSNRSPYPLLHILREDSVSQAVASHPDVERIPDRNADLLEGLGHAHLQKLWLECFIDG